MKDDKDADLLSLARDRMKQAIAAYGDTRNDELDDLRFFAGSPDNQWQWPQDILNSRGAVQGQTINARPSLTINKLPQHVKQVTNDQRQNRPAGKIIPVDDKADIEVAEIMGGIVRHIEYISDADVAIDTACENQVTFGEGYLRILTDYCDENSFEQDIMYGRVRNSFSVYMDPLIQDPCGSDAKWCQITSDMLIDEFEELYPDATPISSLQMEGVGDMGIEAWISEETVKVAEYYYIESTQKTLFLYADGNAYLKDSEESKAYADMAKLAESQGLDPTQFAPVKERETTVQQVKYVKHNGYEVLKRNDWLGKYIPVIRVIGNEFEIDGQLYISGLVRNAKDPQRMYNYWVSQEAEMLALAPKAPFIGYGGQFEGYETQWKQANINNYPYLEINPEAADQEGRPLPLPQRSQPPMASSGLLQAKAGAADDIKSVTGQYDASLGAQGNEKSGKAIMARERQTDTGTYHYVDNLGRAVRYATRQIIDLIPKIYDTQRIARIIGLDGETDHVKIDPSQTEPVQTIRDPQTGAVIQKIYNPSIGKYDVAVTTGPSYMTKRQEAMESMSQLLQGNPQLWQVAGDLFIKNMDWPGAQEMAERFARTIPPQIKGDGEDDPELAQAKQTMQQMQQQIEQMGQVIQQFPESIEVLKIKNSHFDSEVKAFQAETQRLQALGPMITPEDVQQLVMKTLQEVLMSPPLEQEEPQMAGFEPEQPPMGMPTQPQMQPQPQQF